MSKPTPIKLSMSTAASPSIRSMPVRAGKSSGSMPSPYSTPMSTKAGPSISGGRKSYKEPGYGE